MAGYESRRAAAATFLVLGLVFALPGLAALGYRVACSITSCIDPFASNVGLLGVVSLVVGAGCLVAGFVLWLLDRRDRRAELADLGGSHRAA
jgi:hypothetical protein